ncbi:SPOR domain-containing protein [Paramagnetospirillum kuznetsovii]|uniref:SPOR domain-containing protein n=1 Tax=Paramagnetospirillum kuznetsovii TaxID=2053833 RepID=A0A364P1Y6_9PROT|nr:SPOR domain-containing protein [Paramagnetospirillum kuznetsovii]RAU23280.1 SPOR domain-containing protein [Paramagnetospirillum kuznetsovii]
MIQAPLAPPVPLNIPAALAGDHEAQRFYALHRLMEEGVVRPDEAAVRRNANLGALLPYTAPPPAAGLSKPSPLQELATKLSELTVSPSAAAQTERNFLLEGLLPSEPKLRGVPVRTDANALRIGRDRVSTLANMGLVSPAERDRELAAIGYGEQILATAPPPAPPPPPVKKKPIKKKPPVGSEGGAKPGDVPGGAIPPASGKGPMGLHLLSMASDSMTDKAVDALKKEYPELAALTFKAVKTDIPDLGTTYRLLAGPMAQAEADQMCKALRTKGQSCAVAAY